MALSVPMAAQDFLVLEWEQTFSTEDQVEAIQCMDAGDLTNDGIPEIVAGMSFRSQAETQKFAVIVLDKKGTKKYKWESNYPINNVSISDVDSDGTPEIIVSGADLYVLSNTALNLSYPPVGTVVFSAVAADLDNDGKKELLVGTRELICVSDTIPWTAPIGSQVKKIIVEDLDGDSVPEVVALTIQSVHVFDAVGTKVWISPGMQNLRDVTVANIDEDRPQEILFSTDNKLVFIWEARENGMEREIDLGTYRADFLGVEDLNKDGTPEIVVAADNVRLGILDLEGNVLWLHKFQRVEARDAFAAMVLLDMDNDNWTDVLLSHSITAMSGDLDSHLYFMRNYSWFVPPEEEGRKYYDDALALFDSGDCTEAVNLFERAKAKFLEGGDQEMADKCQEYLDQCEEIIAYEAANSVFEQAETYFEEGSYEEALQKYQEAKQLYEQLEDSEKAQECSDRIAEIQALPAPTVPPTESPEEEGSLVPVIMVVVLVVVVVGAFVVVKYVKKPAEEKGVKEKKVKEEKVKEEKVKEEKVKEEKVKEEKVKEEKVKEEKVKRKVKRKVKEKEEKEEEVKEEEPEPEGPPEEISEEERKLKTKFVYGEINRDEYREKLRKLYESED